MLLLSCCIITIYIILVLMKGGIPVSLSSTYYTSNKAPWFSIAMFLSTALMLPALLDISTEQTQWLVFLSCVGNILCAIAPNFKEELEGKLHYGGAILAGILSQIWCNCYNPNTLWMWLVIGGVLLINYRAKIYSTTNLVFWLEVICYLNIYITCFNWI